MTDMFAYISHVSFDYLMPWAIVLTWVTGFGGMLLCIHFNYHYFLIHGEILWGTSSDDLSKVETVKELNSLKWPVGLLDMILTTAMVAAGGTILAIVWPVTILILVMLMILPIMKLVFRGRHKKLQFTLKLKGLVK